MKKITAYLIILFVGMISIKTFAQVNSDKSTISGHMLPDLLISKNGGKIQSSNDWINIRRPEILELFRNYVYGKVPKHEVQIDFKVSKTISDALCGKAKQKEVIVSFSNGKDSVKMNILIFLPANSTKPVPLFLGMNFMLI